MRNVAGITRAGLGADGSSVDADNICASGFVAGVGGTRTVAENEGCEPCSETSGLAGDAVAVPVRDVLNGATSIVG